MDWTSSDAIAVFTYLLPGFVAAWVYYGLTPYSPPSPFERIVQALIFTVVVQAALVLFRELLFVLAARSGYRLGIWTADSALLSSIFIAFGLGLLFSLFANNDGIHMLLRRLRITKETAFASEWFAAFARHPTYVVLHLSGDRRLYGWPEQWPSDPTQGHFALARAEWLMDNNESIPLKDVESIIIPASEVQMVEFMNPNSQEEGEEQADG